MELKFIPYSMYAEGFVSDEDADTLEKYINEDISNFEYKPIHSRSHYLFSTSPSAGYADDNIFWEKYKEILAPYISSFMTSITDNVDKTDLTLYLNWCKKNSFIAPHYDGDIDKTNFIMIYCPKNYENSYPCTTYQASEKYYQTFSKFEKLPLSHNYNINLYHERGKIFIIPSNLYHWVVTLSDDIDRITLMGIINPEFKI